MVTDRDTSNADDPVEPEIKSPAGAFSEVAERLGEARDYAEYYVAAKIDRMKMSVRNAALYAVLGAVGLIVGAMMTAMAVVLFCLGIAGGLGDLFGMGAWLGALVTGFGLLLIIGGGVFAALMYGKKIFRQRTVKAYEQRRREQRQTRGTDVSERSRE